MSLDVELAELERVCNDTLAAYIKGDPGNAVADPPDPSIPPLTGIRRRRPALVALESEELEGEPQEEGSLSLPADPSIDAPARLLLDICALEDFVVVRTQDAIEISFLWVTQYPREGRSPGGDIPAVNFSGDLAGFDLPSTAPVVTPCEGGQAAQVMQECMTILGGRLGDDDPFSPISSRLVTCTFDELPGVRRRILNGSL